jgi:hypothetical protein
MQLWRDPLTGEWPTRRTCAERAGNNHAPAFLSARLTPRGFSSQAASNLQAVPLVGAFISISSASPGPSAVNVVRQCSGQAALDW